MRLRWFLLYNAAVIAALIALIEGGVSKPVFGACGIPMIVVSVLWSCKGLAEIADEVTGAKR